jgi:hypothetical protein
MFEGHTQGDHPANNGIDSAVESTHMHSGNMEDSIGLQVVQQVEASSTTLVRSTPVVGGILLTPH